MYIPHRQFLDLLFSAPTKSHLWTADVGWTRKGGLCTYDCACVTCIGCYEEKKRNAVPCYYGWGNSPQIFMCLNPLEEQILHGNNCVSTTKKNLFSTAASFCFTFTFISKGQLCSARLIFAINLFELRKLLFHQKPHLAWDSFCHIAGFHNAAVVFVCLVFRVFV